jgi:hypothetical protein
MKLRLSGRVELSLGCFDNKDILDMHCGAVGKAPLPAPQRWKRFLKIVYQSPTISKFLPFPASLALGYGSLEDCYIGL